MPKTSQVVKSGKKPKYSTRNVRRCGVCGRKRSYIQYYGLCRICFREKATKGQLPGVSKASW